MTCPCGVHQSDELGKHKSIFHAITNAWPAVGVIDWFDLL